MFKKNQGKSKPSFVQHQKAHAGTPATLDKITAKNKGMTFILEGVVNRIVQTGGPTIFHLSDGTGSLALKGFEGAGVRAYADINEGDSITAKVEIEEYQGELEGEIKDMKKLSSEEHAAFVRKIEEVERKRAAITPPEFLVKSPILDKLREKFIKAATDIRLAIIQSRPIIVRHHNDADGYSSGFALERAILPLIEKEHTGAKAAWEFYTRAPCNAPMYEIDDSIRDTAHSLANAAKFSNKMPLVIIVDTGSGREDLLGIQQGKVHGIDFIVVDHHRFDEDVISNEVLVHINPFLVGEDGAQFSAGMLCTELARFINTVDNVVQIPAMAGMADRINNPQVMDAYLKIAEKKGYSKELLNDIATVIDFVSSKLRFMEAREYIEVLFGEPMDKQKALVALLAPYIRDLESKGLAIAREAATTKMFNDITIQMLDIESTFPRGFYPKPGKCTGLVHDDIQTRKKLTKVITLGIMADAVTMRATDGANFSVQELIEHLNKKLPAAFVEGGGHKNAGSIKFVPSYKAKILAELDNYLKSKSN